MYFVYTRFLCKYFSSSVDDDTYASYACILYTLTFCASIFHHQSMVIHVLLMHVFLYTCFLCKYFSSSVDDDTHASYACILYTLAFCASIFHRPFTIAHMLFMQMFFFCHPFMMCIQIFISEFFRAIMWTIVPFGCFILHLNFES